MSTGLFPMLQPTLAREEQELPLCKEVAWDFREGKPLFQNGQPRTVTGREAVQVWVWKALRTQRCRYEIYSWNFGCELESLIGQNYTEELKQAEARRYVREALEINPYIEDISDITVAFAGGVLSIGATVQTIYGEVKAYV